MTTTRIDCWHPTDDAAVPRWMVPYLSGRDFGPCGAESPDEVGFTCSRFAHGTGRHLAVTYGGDTVTEMCAAWPGAHPPVEADVNPRAVRPPEPIRDGHLLDITALVAYDHDDDPTTATQWAVRRPNGSTCAYGDQTWVSSGQAAEEDQPGTVTMWRQVTITYGPWVEATR